MFIPEVRGCQIKRPATSVRYFPLDCQSGVSKRPPKQGRLSPLLLVPHWKQSAYTDVIHPTLLFKAMPLSPHCGTLSFFPRRGHHYKSGSGAKQWLWQQSLGTSISHVHTSIHNLEPPSWCLNTACLKLTFGVRKVTQNLRAHSALPEDWSLVLNTHISWLATAHNSSSRNSSTLLVAMASYPQCTFSHIDTSFKIKYRQRKKKTTFAPK